jgi:hypothetical protein
MRSFPTNGSPRTGCSGVEIGLFYREAAQDRIGCAIASWQFERVPKEMRHEDTRNSVGKKRAERGACRNRYCWSGCRGCGVGSVLARDGLSGGDDNGMWAALKEKLGHSPLTDILARLRTVCRFVIGFGGTFSICSLKRRTTPAARLRAQPCAEISAVGQRDWAPSAAL